MPLARSRRVGTAVLVAVVAVIMAPVPGIAHDFLVASTPELGSTVSEPPTEVTLEFNTSIGQQFAQVAVVDADGTAYQSGDPVVDGPVVTQAVAGLQAGAEVTISYRVVSSDGHPIGGTIPFSIAPAAAAAQTTPEPDPPPTPATDSAGTGTGTGTDATQPTADETTGAASTTEAGDSASVSPAVWVGALAVALLIVAAFVGLTRRRTRTPSS